jgi:hypothetical protein
MKRWKRTAQSMNVVRVVNDQKFVNAAHAEPFEAAKINVMRILRHAASWPRPWSGAADNDR